MRNDCADLRIRTATAGGSRSSGLERPKLRRVRCDSAGRPLAKPRAHRTGQWPPCPRGQGWLAPVRLGHRQSRGWLCLCQDPIGGLSSVAWREGYGIVITFENLFSKWWRVNLWCSKSERQGLQWAQQCREVGIDLEARWARCR
jgi:hypothetical protein